MIKSIMPKSKDTKDTKESKEPVTPPKEVGGRKGPDPTRYGDWENKGIAHDF